MRSTLCLVVGVSAAVAGVRARSERVAVGALLLAAALMAVAVAWWARP